MRYIALFAVALGMVCAGCQQSECREVKEVLRCGMNECRVVLDTGERATILNIVAVGDRVRVYRYSSIVEGRVRSCELEEINVEKLH